MVWIVIGSTVGVVFVILGLSALIGRSKYVADWVWLGQHLTTGVICIRCDGKGIFIWSSKQDNYILVDIYKQIYNQAPERIVHCRHGGIYFYGDQDAAWQLREILSHGYGMAIAERVEKGPLRGSTIVDM